MEESRTATVHADRGSSRRPFGVVVTRAARTACFLSAFASPINAMMRGEQKGGDAKAEPRAGVGGVAQQQREFQEKYSQFLQMKIDQASLEWPLSGDSVDPTLLPEGYNDTPAVGLHSSPGETRPSIAEPDEEPPAASSFSPPSRRPSLPQGHGGEAHTPPSMPATSPSTPFLKMVPVPVLIQQHLQYPDFGNAAGNRIPTATATKAQNWGPHNMFPLPGNQMQMQGSQMMSMPPPGLLVQQQHFELASAAAAALARFAAANDLPQQTAPGASNGATLVLPIDGKPMPVRVPNMPGAVPVTSAATSPTTTYWTGPATEDGASRSGSPDFGALSPSAEEHRERIARLEDNLARELRDAQSAAAQQRLQELGGLEPVSPEQIVEDADSHADALDLAQSRGSSRKSSTSMVSAAGTVGGAASSISTAAGSGLPSTGDATPQNAQQGNQGPAPPREQHVRAVVVAQQAAATTSAAITSAAEAAARGSSGAAPAVVNKNKLTNKKLDLVTMDQKKALNQDRTLTFANALRQDVLDYANGRYDEFTFEEKGFPALEQALDVMIEQVKSIEENFEECSTTPTAAPRRWCQVKTELCTGKYCREGCWHHDAGNTPSRPTWFHGGRGCDFAHKIDETARNCWKTEPCRNRQCRQKMNAARRALNRAKAEYDPNRAPFEGPGSKWEKLMDAKARLSELDHRCPFYHADDCSRREGEHPLEQYRRIFPERCTTDGLVPLKGLLAMKLLRDTNKHVTTLADDERTLLDAQKVWRRERALQPLLRDAAQFAVEFLEVIEELRHELELSITEISTRFGNLAPLGSRVLDVAMGLDQVFPHFTQNLASDRAERLRLAAATLKGVPDVRENLRETIIFARNLVELRDLKGIDMADDAAVAAGIAALNARNNYKAPPLEDEEEAPHRQGPRAVESAAPPPAEYMYTPTHDDLPMICASPCSMTKEDADLLARARCMQQVYGMGTSSSLEDCNRSLDAGAAPGLHLPSHDDGRQRVLHLQNTDSGTAAASSSIGGVGILPHLQQSAQQQQQPYSPMLPLLMPYNSPEFSPQTTVPPFPFLSRVPTATGTTTPPSLDPAPQAADRFEKPPRSPGSSAASSGSTPAHAALYPAPAYPAPSALGLGDDDDIYLPPAALPPHQLPDDNRMPGSPLARGRGRGRGPQTARGLPGFDRLKERQRLRSAGKKEKGGASVTTETPRENRATAFAAVASRRERPMETGAVPGAGWGPYGESDTPVQNEDDVYDERKTGELTDFGEGW